MGDAPAAVRALSTGLGRSGQRADSSADTDSTSRQGGEPGELRVRRLFDSGGLGLWPEVLGSFGSLSALCRRGALPSSGQELTACFSSAGPDHPEENCISWLLKVWKASASTGVGQEHHRCPGSAVLGQLPHGGATSGSPCCPTAPQSPQPLPLPRQLLRSPFLFKEWNQAQYLRGARSSPPPSRETC